MDETALDPDNPNYLCIFDNKIFAVETPTKAGDIMGKKQQQIIEKNICWHTQRIRNLKRDSLTILTWKDPNILTIITSNFVTN